MADQKVGNKNAILRT